MEKTKLNPEMPHLHTEAIMVDLLKKTTVSRLDIPECYQQDWDSFFKLKPQYVGRELFWGFYDFLAQRGC